MVDLFFEGYWQGNGIQTHLFISSEYSGIVRKYVIIIIVRCEIDEQTQERIESVRTYSILILLLFSRGVSLY